MDFSTPAPAARDPEQAKVYLERAMDHVIDLKNDEAWEWAQKAFRADPDLANDGYARGVAAEITGTDESVAVQALMSNRAIGMTDKPKRGDKRSDADVIPWSKALVGVGIYSLLMGVFAFIPMLIFGQFIAMVISMDEPSLGTVSTGAVGIIAAIVALVVIIWSLISFFMQTGVMHIIASMGLGGDGNYTNLIYHLRMPFILQTIVGIILVSIATFAVFSDLPTDPAVWEYMVETENYEAFESTLENIMLAYGLMLLYAVSAIGFTIWMSFKVTKVYDIGWGKGCATLLLTGIAMSIINGMLNQLISMIFYNY